MNPTIIVLLLLSITSAVYADRFPVSDKTAQEVFGQRKGAFVLIDCSSDDISILDPEASSEKLPPCSTFKIWNTLIGLENGVVHSSNDAFYKWDGQTRFIPD